MKSKYFIKALSLLLLIQCYGCKKFVEVGPPKTLLSVDVTFQNDASATSAVLGIYNMMSTTNSSIANGAMSFYPGISSDELNKFTASEEEGQFLNNTLSSTNSINSGIWSYTYTMIGQANSCIEGLTAAKSLTPSLKSQLIGEAKIARALFYFYLVNLYGDVPLVTTTSWNQTMTIGRNPVTQVYAQIIADLKDAVNETSATYPTVGKVRPNKYVALALLARVYLYTQDYTNAEAAATQVIESGLYSSLPDIDNAFLGESSEAIWQLQPISTLTYVTMEGQIFIPRTLTSPPVYYLTDELLNAFEPGDKRKTHWINSVAYQGKTYYYPYKYKQANNANGYNEYYTILRLSETYLIRAEARAQNNDISGAVGDLNVIRDRARAVATPDVPNPLPALSVSLSRANALIAVQKENRTEFFAEWGHRWFDLKRTGHADEVLKVIKPNYNTNSQLYPIPHSEMLLDKNLTQNEGYN